MDQQKMERLREVQNFKDFAENTSKEIDDMIESIGWTVESIENFKPLLECPFNSSHHIYEQKLEDHLERCQWQAEGYAEWDIPLSEPTIPSNASSSIQFDEQLLEEVLLQAKLNNPTMNIGAGNRLIPRTSDRLISDFTSDERKAIYEYVIAKTIKPDVGEDIADLNKPKKQSDKSSSYLELLAQERDLKRRRAKHRGVHTNKKSQIEILREVINQQMDMLQEYIAERNGCEKEEDNSTIKTGNKDNACEDTKNNFEERSTKNNFEEKSTKNNKYKINGEKEKRDYSYHHDNRDYYYKRHHDNHRDYYYDRRDSSRSYRDDDEYSSCVDKSSRDHDRKSQKNYYSEERKKHNDYDKSNDHHSRHNKHEYEYKHKKHSKKHKRHRSRESSSRHSSKTKYENEKSEKRRQ